MYYLLCSLYFFFKVQAPPELYTTLFVGSVRCVKETALRLVAPAWWAQVGRPPGGGGNLQVLRAVYLAVAAQRPRPAYRLVSPLCLQVAGASGAVPYTHPRAHETEAEPVCRLLLEKKNYLLLNSQRSLYC